MGDEDGAPDTLAHADFDLAIVGLFFDASVRDELARRLPDVDGQAGRA